MDMWFEKLWISLKYLVDVSNCAFGNDPNEIELTHYSHSTPNAFSPCDVDIIREDDGNMNQFINDCLDNLEGNASFYPSIKKKDPPTIPPLKMFGYLHLEIEVKVEPKFPTKGKPSSSKKSNTQSFYDKKLINTTINLEETYGKGFTILRKQGCDTRSEHESHQLLEKKPTDENTKGLRYQDSSYKKNPPREYLWI